MRQILFILLALLVQNIYASNKTVHLDTAGALSVTMTQNELQTVTNLTITGKMDARDFNTLRSNVQVLKTLDISTVQIKAYDTDADDELPKDAFKFIYFMNSVTLPATLKSIGQYAFRTCRSLKSITIPVGVTKIKGSAFSACKSLKVVTVPNSVTEMGNGVFDQCDSLETVVLPNSLTSLGTAFFSGCLSLVNVTLPPNLKTIGQAAFYNCQNLPSLQLPETVDTIKAEAFRYCLRLESINSPKNIKAIYSSTYNGCRLLTTYSIPAGVINIYPTAFSECESLTSLYAYPVTPPDLEFSPGVFFGVDKVNCILYVPAGSKALYEVAEQWKDFENIVEMTVSNIKTNKQLNIDMYNSNGNLVISNAPINEPLSVYNINGVTVYQGVSESDKVEIPLNANGVYFIRVSNQTIKYYH